MMRFKKKVQILNSTHIKASVARRKEKGTLDYSTALTVDLGPDSDAVSRESAKFRAKIEQDRLRLGLV